MLAAAAGRALARATGGHGAAAAGLRHMSNVPEFWGRDSPYHGGTEFLGTPANHLDLAAKRPVAPHVFEVDAPATPHYAMPINALTSVLNRATGVALFGASVWGGYLALASPDLAVCVASWAAAHPFLAVPARAAVVFPLAYHYAGGLRHLWWDAAKHGNQAAHEGPLEKGAVDTSSYAVLGASAAATVLAALA